MAAAIIDIDGTMVFWGTYNFLPGAVESVRAFMEAGNEVIFVTQREPDALLHRMLGKSFPGCHLIENISSPRILINDAGVACVHHPKDGPWTYDLTGIAAQA